MDDINTTVLTGRATNGAEAGKGKESGQSYADFGLAVSHRRGETIFINIRAFGKQAEWATKCVTKGRRYSVVGRLDGKGGRAKVIPNSISFQDFPRENGAGETPAKKGLRDTAEKMRPKKE